MPEGDNQNMLSPDEKPSVDGKPSGDQQNQQGTDWKASLADEYKTNESISGYKDINELVKNHLELVSKGTPVKPTYKDEEYSFTKPEKYPEDVPFDDSLATWWASTAKELGMSPQQAKELFDKYTNFGIERFNQLRDVVKQDEVKAQAELERANESAKEALKTEWGAKFETNVELTRRFLKYFGGEELVKELIDNGMGNSTLLMKSLFKAASVVRDDTLSDLTSTKDKEQELLPGQLQFNYPSMVK